MLIYFLPVVILGNNFHFFTASISQIRVAEVISACMDNQSRWYKTSPGKPVQDIGFIDLAIFVITRQHAYNFSN